MNGNYKVWWFLFICYYTAEFFRPQYFSDNIALLRPGLVFGTALIAFSCFQLKKAKKNISSVSAQLFLLLVLLWVPFAHNNYYALNTAKVMLLNVAVLMTAMPILINTKARIGTMVNVLIINSTFLAGFVIVSGGTGPGAFLADENDMALMLNILLPFSVCLSFNRKFPSKTRLFCGLNSLLVCVAVVLTGSRGGILGFLAVITIIFLLHKHRLRNFLFLFVIAGALYPLVPQSYVQEWKTIGDVEDSTRLSRFHTWAIGWEMFKDNPVLGVGPGNYPWRTDEYEDEVIKKNPEWSGRRHGGRAAHSLYFTLLPEMGLVGALLFVLIVIDQRRTNQLSIKSKDPQIQVLAFGTSAALIGFLVTSLFISVLYYPAFWLLCGLNEVIRRADRPERDYARLEPILAESKRCGASIGSAPTESGL